MFRTLALLLPAVVACQQAVSPRHDPADVRVDSGPASPPDEPAPIASWPVPTGVMSPDPLAEEFFTARMPLAACPVSIQDEFGASANATCNPIGGGEGYQFQVDWDDCDAVVATRDELLAGLASARRGDMICVDGAATISLSGLEDIVIPAGVTLASDRGRDGAPGALLYTRTNRYLSLLRPEDGVRITGLRIRGPSGDIDLDDELVKGIDAAAGARIEVDNCELYQWPVAAVRLSEGYVHFNHIHHNRRPALGYGVSVRGGDGDGALIQANLFDANRHSLAGQGDAETRYEARYNLVGPEQSGHAFDMHEIATGGCEWYPNGEFRSGAFFEIHHNTFTSRTDKAIGIRGTPTEPSTIHHNWFYNDDPRNTVTQKNGARRVESYANRTGEAPDAPIAEVGPLRHWQGLVAKCVEQCAELCADGCDLQGCPE